MNNQPTSSEPIQEQTEVTNAMNSLGEMTGCLAKSVDEIEIRLTAVLKGSRSIETPDEKESELYETSLAQGINKIHDEIQNLKKRLDNLLDRLEL